MEASNSSLQGKLLIAASHLPDSNFSQTVVLMVQHGDEGGLGLILNRPSDRWLKEIWTQLSDSPCPHDFPINLGGPVAGPLMSVHTQPEWGEFEVVPGVFFTAQEENLAALVSDGQLPSKFFVGYAGWGEGQLENELENGDWTVLPATSDWIFTWSEDELWNHAHSQSQRPNFSNLLGVSRLPPDPLVN